MRYGSDTSVPVVPLRNSESHGNRGATMSKSGATKRYCYGTTIPVELPRNTVMTLVYRLSNAIILCYKISHHSYDTRVPSERQRDTVMTLAGCRFVDVILSVSNLKQLPVADSLNMPVSNRQLNSLKL